MTQVRQAQLEQLGFQRTHTGKGLAGTRLWWKRVDASAMHVVRQADERWKEVDLGDGHPALPEDTPESNRSWAIAIAENDLYDWRD